MESAGIDCHCKNFRELLFSRKGTPRSSSGLKFVDESDAFVLFVLT
jgi:hypothetical protein